MKSLRENPTLPFNMVFNSCKASSQLLAGMMMEQGRRMLPTSEDLNQMFPYPLSDPQSSHPSSSSSGYVKLSLDMVFIILSYLTAEELAVYTTCVHKLDPPTSSPQL
ncbi:hypothetical protein EON65_51550, partial [archaeon]